jgi:hypothetical protein
MNKFEKIRISFRPDRVKTLFIGESAPDSGRFFYNSDSSLFHAMKRAFGSQSTFLDDFKANGFYLDDLVQRPVNKLANTERTRLRWEFVSKLANRLMDYKPEATVIVMRAIRPMVLKAMQMAGICYEPYCTPHPAFGNWNRFHIAMTEIISSLPVTDGRNRKGLTK